MENDFPNNVMNGLSNIFSIMSDPERSEKLLNKIQSMSDKEMNFLGKIDNIPDDMLPIFKSILKGETCNLFFEELNNLKNPIKLRTGDIILVTGKKLLSKALVKTQKKFYSNARSSHVAIIHSDYICIDANLKTGVSNRLISDVLTDVEDDWKIIRFNNINEDDSESLAKKCVFYLNQPYKIINSNKKRSSKYSYCSKLAQRIFEDCNIANTGIPKKGSYILPCDFDRIADSNKDWTDITENVKSEVEFCIKYAPILKVHSKLFIHGLKLNQKRYAERRKLIEKLEDLKTKGNNTNLIEKLIEEIKKTEDSLNFNFWNFGKL